MEIIKYEHNKRQSIVFRGHGPEGATTYVRCLPNEKQRGMTATLNELEALAQYNPPSEEGSLGRRSNAMRNLSLGSQAFENRIKRTLARNRRRNNIPYNAGRLELYNHAQACGLLNPILFDHIRDREGDLEKVFDERNNESPFNVETDHGYIF